MGSRQHSARSGAKGKSQVEVPQFIGGRFRIETEIGKGGMGTVYRATHLGLQRSVAVKIIKPEFAGDPDVADRFMREARTMAKLRHPHAAMIFDAGNLPDGRHFIIMEFVEGQTLSDLLSREGRFAAERAVQIAMQICDVLHEAHQLGIIHRDLKPSNIMLNDRGVCVLDFGVAKVLASPADATSSQASTGSGQIVGTPRYMSPEQCLGQRVGARSDLYSLGVLLYEMLAGRPPFIDPMPSVVLVKQATAPPPPLPKLRSDIPRSLALAVHTLLAKRPEDRPLTAGAARTMLAKSLVQPERIEIPEIDPMSSTVASVGNYRGLWFRVAFPLGLVAILGSLLLILSYGGSAAENVASNNSMKLAESVPTATTGAISAPTQVAEMKEVAIRNSPTSGLSQEQARRIVSSMSHGNIGALAVARNLGGSSIVAVHEETSPKATHFFVMERRGEVYRIVDRGMLDTPSFRGRQWTAETLAVHEDGANQVAIASASADQGAAGVRVVIYDPATRETYAVRIETDQFGRARKIHWSSNCTGVDAAPYRVALRDKARALLTQSSRG